MSDLGIAQANAAGLAWAQRTVAERHYRHAPIDPRGRPLAYLVVHVPSHERVGVLMCSRPESTTTRPLWGSLADLAAGRVTHSYWSVICLSRVWLDPRIQRGGCWYRPSAATWAIGQVRRRVVLDYLLAHPPVDCACPWALQVMVSYCQPEHHVGTIYKAAGFALARTNGEGLQTWTHPLRGLQPHERLQVPRASEQSERSRQYRSARATAGVAQLPFAWEGEGVSL